MEKIFAACGFQVKIHEQIQKLVWHKLFTNVSLSVLTGILQVDMGFIAENEHAWKLTGRKVKPAISSPLIPRILTLSPLVFSAIHWRAQWSMWM